MNLLFSLTSWLKYKFYCYFLWYFNVQNARKHQIVLDFCIVVIDGWNTLLLFKKWFLGCTLSTFLRTSWFLYIEKKLSFKWFTFFYAKFITLVRHLQSATGVTLKKHVNYVEQTGKMMQICIMRVYVYLGHIFRRGIRIINEKLQYLFALKLVELHSHIDKKKDTVLQTQRRVHLVVMSYIGLICII